jgi:hypothetical protein
MQNLNNMTSIAVMNFFNFSSEHHDVISTKYLSCNYKKGTLKQLGQPIKGMKCLKHKCCFCVEFHILNIYCDIICSYLIFHEFF